MNTKTKDFLMALEAERHDTSWRNNTPRERYAPTQPIVIKSAQPNQKEQQARDQIMFHAGRYAEGARDSQAVSANNRVASLIHGNKSNKIDSQTVKGS